jgi:hypothetical protein
MISVYPQSVKKYSVEVNKGNVSGVSVVNKFGHALDCDAGVPTDVWGGADSATSTDIWAPPTQARIHQVSSTSASDTLLGTGLRTIRVFYLSDWDTEEQSVDLNMNGVGNVATPSNVIINRMEGLTWGSGGLNAGIVTATADTDLTITAVIQAGDNQTEQCIYGFPSTKDLLVSFANATVFRGGGVASQLTGNLLYMPDPETNTVNNTAWVIREELDDIEGSPPWQHRYDPEKRFEGPGIFKIQVTSSTNNTESTAVFDAYLTDK